MHTLTGFMARLLTGLPMLVFGIMHFINSENMTGMVPSFMPGGAELWVMITGVALVLAGLAIVTSIFIAGISHLVYWACILLGLMLLGFALMIHLPNLSSSETAMPMLLKDLGLAGGAWALARQFENQNRIESL